MDGFSIGEVAAQTGVAEGTLRIWERRHGFPAPARLPGGHRRYSQRDLEQVGRVCAQRAAGVPLALAIDRAVRESSKPVPSLFAALRERHPEVEARAIPKRILAALSHAIEDESLSRAERPLLFGSFQRERFYRQEQPRWREIARGAELCAVFADFDPGGGTGADGPAEIAVDRNEPLAREWAIVCDAPAHAVCLAAWEPPKSRGVGGERRFESIWSVDPGVVRNAARICSAIAGAARPELIGALQSRLDAPPEAVATRQLQLAAAITNRMLSYLN